MIKTSTNHIPLLVGVVLAAMLILAPRVTQAQDTPTVIHACYIPTTGLMYRIKAEGLPDTCRAADHVAFHWAVSMDESPTLVPPSTVAPGEVADEPGATPSAGVAVGTSSAAAGSRMFWDPGKSAFRVGTATGTQWDDANVGTHSYAMGYNTTASGYHSTAMGRDTEASGEHATATGEGTLASGYYSTAMGSQTKATFDHATAMGQNTTASGLSSTAMGRYTTASAYWSTAMGNETTADGNNATAMGYKTTANGENSTSMGNSTGASGPSSTAMGYQTVASAGTATAMGYKTTASGGTATAMGNETTASATSATAMGKETTASGGHSTAMGRNTEASGGSSTAMGGYTEANGDFSTAMGNDTEASGYSSTTMGYNTKASGWYSTALGYRTVAQAYGSLVLGRLNRVEGSPDRWVQTDPLLVVGYGEVPTERQNALTLLKNGNLTIAGILSENSDARIKQDIQPLSDVLSKLGAVRGVSYRFTDGRGPAGQHVGLLAQEVKRAFPELVLEDSDGELSVAYGKFTAVLLEAIKEQQEMIAELTATVRRLEAGTEK